MVALNLIIQAGELAYYLKKTYPLSDFSNPSYVPSFPVRLDRTAAGVFWGPLTTLHFALKIENQNPCWGV